jgi:hypothetical protein
MSWRFGRKAKVRFYGSLKGKEYERGTLNQALEFLH